MHYNLKFLNISGELYIFNEVDWNIYKLSNRSFNKNVSFEEMQSITKQLMKKNGYLKEDMEYERILDCSGYVDICELVLQKDSAENQNLCKKLRDKYHIDSCNILYDEVLYKNEEHTIEDKELNNSIKTIFNCKGKLSKDILHKAQREWIQYSEITSNDIEAYPVYINKLLSNMIHKEPRFFSCDWGINKMYIKNGILYRCKNCNGKPVNLAEYGCISSVDEHETCKFCYARYLCGGLCMIKPEELEGICHIIRKVVDFILELYIKQSPNKVIEI